MKMKFKVDKNDVKFLSNILKSCNYYSKFTSGSRYPPPPDFVSKLRSRIWVALHLLHSVPGRGWKGDAKWSSGVIPRLRSILGRVIWNPTSICICKSFLGFIFRPGFFPFSARFIWHRSKEIRLSRSTGLRSRIRVQECGMSRVLFAS